MVRFASVMKFLAHLLVIFCFCPLVSFGQNQSTIDSLNTVIENTQDDSVKAINYIYIAIEYQAHYDYSNFFKQLEEAEKIGDRSNNKHILSEVYSRFGDGYRKVGDLPNAFKYYDKTFKLAEETKDTFHISETYKDLGYLYFSQGEYEAALKNFEDGLELGKLVPDNDREIGKAYNNMGVVHKTMKNYEPALDYLMKSLEIRLSQEDWRSVCGSYTNIGGIYEAMDSMDNAIKYYHKSLNLRLEVADTSNLTHSYRKLARISMKEGKMDSAVYYSEKATEFAEITKDAIDLKSAALVGYQIQRKHGNVERALELLELYKKLADSLDNESNQKQAIRSQFQYSYHKQALHDSLKNAEEMRVQTLELDHEKKQNKLQRQRTYVLYGGLAIVFILMIFVYNRYRISQKQKKIIELQKKEVEEQKEKVDLAYDELEEKNTEILDSINYAKRIQTAILPPQKLVKEYLADSFILYKPKDIVAGDFYWMEPIIKTSNSNVVLFAAADCTGHGVPGAMVSVVCNNGLNRSVREHGLTEPGQILDKTREIVIAEFEKSEEEVKDGMDIALCSLEGTTLKYAGANNPLWIIRSHAAESFSDGAKGAEAVEEIKANKQPIGKYAEPLPYTTHTIELQKGDSFYIFSDGYADQFGGERGKKFKAANFKRLLLSIQNENIEQQKLIIDKAFEDWKNAGGEALEQLDDVCVIGVRV